MKATSTESGTASSSKGILDPPTAHVEEGPEMTTVYVAAYATELSR
jgi:hypothetical protein